MLNNNHNLVFGTTIIPFIKLALILVFIMSFFAAIRLSNELDALSFTLVSVTAFTTLMLMAPIAIVMSTMFDISAKFSRNLAPRIQLVPVKRVREIFIRQLKSCHLIRCQVGSMYHMEAKAKLTMTHNVVNGVVFLLVNAPK